ncbi:Glycoside hydrolase, family 57 [Trichormus variabilis ATCC 29413]|uniref:Glycoside hydrolase, family 57 n=2 Tax=Anabaena variabilis TaxID=264691 RepID=Q3M8P1_TRIV2|nr:MULTISPECIES: glycoside hydrolase [Nostocaceae]ABA22645.1 Glycoside hydrolase, family 57 [Trichormus variabilis ATCC 29413]MBC1215897.1 glycoside hydrolase [Trichormus variabilis ARAD]MBC1254129.1 glycoside hydrolase [Trichormus variabilis V5]MBC1267060.1 glycoside hydrolase [Trichormus variabilis FSR]MBC1303698.1 glycoside hydrolase [Trichormus variabilis N2B]
MTHPLYVAFIWHQHQPLYKSPGSSLSVPSSQQYRLPWVRLHGTKDYLDLILILEKYPKLHQTVNLVPSLILQLEDYIAGTAFDPYLKASLTPTEQLTQQQREFIIQHFFDANHHTLIDPHPRYAELYYQRQEKGPAWCLANWQLADYSDLLAWHNLAWIDPLFWDDPEIAAWLQQGRNFTLGDRQRIYSKQRDILSRIIPQHRKMQESGQLEVTTTPYTHPILPLLADTNSGRVAVPNMALPESRFQWSEDIPRHLRKAWELYTERFGQEPKGLWPSEQSVSPDILPYIIKQGFQWICSDEAVLGWTLKHFFHRDGAGNVQQPELLYRPYRLATPAGDLAIVFRDHRLSDLIGFTYGAMPAKQAAADLVGHLQAIAKMQRERPSEQPWLVTIALDGENCWEFYPQDGKPFLEALYQSLSNESHIKLVTVSEFIEEFPATATIPAEQLHSGSWVDGSFTTWIGDPAKNRAWDYLTEARIMLANHPEATEENNPEAWEALYAAEGSDWFWWFGEGHSSNQDAIFDQLFREHLCGIYKALNEPIPAYLKNPVEVHAARADHSPEGFIHPVIDGRGDEQDWDKAGRIEIGGARGTMHNSSIVQRLWYGVDHLNFYLRVDFKSGVTPGHGLPPELNLLWFYPDRTMHNSPIPLADVPDTAPLNYLFHHHLEINLLTQSIQFREAAENYQWHPRFSRAQVALENCLEVAIPWADLQVPPDYPLRLILVLADEGRFSKYLPEDTLIPIEVP